MTPCTVTTGFFVLGRCGRPSVADCPRCRRRVCAEHADPQSGTCPECAAAQGYGSDDPHDPTWIVRYRRRHYEQAHASYQGGWTTYDDYDRGAFNPGDDWSYGSGDFGAGDDGGFVDS
ncbi:hypothetical protein [Spirillospora albida]|uniref:hypothetical protein n=1 Tax=Spirillospora albida TaxID=58123 RepID=UPI0004C1E814|nr:hypothetical protein [Spirillospora albida]